MTAEQLTPQFNPGKNIFAVYFGVAILTFEIVKGVPLKKDHHISR